jgi:hypothetical protein
MQDRAAQGPQTKLPWRGLTKADTWARLRAGALNLDRIGRLGLIG